MTKEIIQLIIFQKLGLNVIISSDADKITIVIVIVILSISIQLVMPVVRRSISPASSLTSFVTDSSDEVRGSL